MLGVGDGVLDIPTAVRRQFGMRENLPIEVKFSRRVVEDADPYGIILILDQRCKSFAIFSPLGSSRQSSRVMALSTMTQPK